MLITVFILKLLKAVFNQVEAGRLQRPCIHPETVGATPKLISAVHEGLVSEIDMLATKIITRENISYQLDDDSGRKSPGDIMRVFPNASGFYTQKINDEIFVGIGPYSNCRICRYLQN